MATVAGSASRTSSPTRPRLIAEVPMCGRTVQRIARHGLEPHRHPAAVEICLVVRGELDWWVEDQEVTVSAGQIFVTHPDELHGGVGAILHPSTFDWFQVDASAGGDIGQLRDELVASRVRLMDAPDPLRRAVTAVVSEHERRDHYAAIAARAALTVALVIMTRQSAVADRRLLSDPVRQSISMLAGRPAEQLSVEALAGMVGLSSSRLQARFRAELNCSVGEYSQRLRFQRARTALRGSETSIAEVAHGLGFSSSQHFATAFRRRFGCTPSEYRTSTFH